MLVVEHSLVLLGLSSLRVGSSLRGGFPVLLAGSNLWGRSLGLGGSSSVPRPLPLLVRFLVLLGGSRGRSLS